MFGWRVWLAVISAHFLAVGLLSASDLGATLQPVSQRYWSLVWIPSGAWGLWLAIKNRPPAGHSYSLIPSLWAVGAAARSLGLLYVGGWVGAIAWGMIVYMVVWGWGKAMAPAVAKVEPRG